MFSFGIRSSWSGVSWREATIKCGGKRKEREYLAKSSVYFQTSVFALSKHPSLYLTQIILTCSAQVLIHTIRSEIASCSEKAYPSLPVSNAKNLLFLDSDAAVLEYASSRGWIVRDDSRIYFPSGGQQGGASGGTEKDILVASGTVIENTIGYARELETIV